MVKGYPYSKMSGMRGPDIFKEIDNVSSVEDAQRIATEVSGRQEKANSKNDKHTLLEHIILQTAKHEYLRIVVKAMLSRPEFRMNESTKGPKTPFFLAICKYKQNDITWQKPFTLNIIQDLLQDPRTDINNCGIDPSYEHFLETTSNGTTISCNSPLMYAISLGVYDIAHLLISSPKIDLNKVNANNMSAFNFAYKNQKNPKSYLKGIKHKKEIDKIIQALLQRNEIDWNKMLEIALRNFKEELPFIIFLVENAQARVDINKLYYLNENTSYTLLHRAALNGPKELIIFLLQNPSINFNMENKVGMTALNYAILSNRIDIVKLFLEKKDLNINTGTIPSLMFAVKMNNLEIVKEILKSKSAKLQLGFQTGSALPEPARKILAHFSKPNSVAIKDEFGKLIPVGITNQDITLPLGSTALSIAVQNANADMVQILLRNYEWDKGYLVSLLRTDAEIKINEYLYKPINELLSDHGNPAAKRRRPDVTEKALEAPESPEAPVEHQIILEPAEQQVSSSQQQQQQEQQHVRQTGQIIAPSLERPQTGWVPSVDEKNQQARQYFKQYLKQAQERLQQQLQLIEQQFQKTPQDKPGNQQLLELKKKHRQELLGLIQNKEKQIETMVSSKDLPQFLVQLKMDLLTKQDQLRQKEEQQADQLRIQQQHLHTQQQQHQALQQQQQHQ